MGFNNPRYDALKEQLLRDWRAALPNADTSEGSIIYADCSVLASAIWGLYKNQSWLLKNMVPDAPSRSILERWARIYGIVTEGKTDVEILNEFIERLRRPAAGGNKADVERWARNTTSNGILTFPLELATPAALINDGLASFVPENFTDGDEMTNAFKTGGVASGSNFILDYGSGESEDLVALGMWKYNEEDVSFSVEYSDEGSVWNPLVGSFVLDGLGWSFTEWDSVGPRRFWRVTLLAETTADVGIGEVEFYSAGVETVSAAVAYPNWAWIGTFHLVCSRTSSRISNKLLEAVFDAVDFRIPIAPHEFWVLRPKEIGITVEVEVQGPANLGVIETEIRNYIRNLSPSEPFFVAQVTLICLQNGATGTPNVILPEADVFPNEFEELVEESITVTAV